MGIFDKADQRTIPTSETTIIASGAKIEGIFNCQTRLHIDGEIAGKVFSDSVITIGKQGCICGEVIAPHLIVNGVFEGSADCDHVEVLEGGKFLGKVLSKELVIEARAIFEGESKLKVEETLPPMITLEDQ